MALQYKKPQIIVFGRHETENWYPRHFSPEYASLPKIYFCEFCLNHSISEESLDAHLRTCCWRTPPGNEVYHSDDITIFEVDGAANEAYCKNLSLLSRIFLECKYSTPDVESYDFYVVTKNDSYGCHLAGFFNKEKNVSKRFFRINLSCIVVLPQYQRQGFGTFLIRFSYLLSMIEGVPGTPERPFSDLGERLYHSYWKTSLIEYLDRCRKLNRAINIDIMSLETGIRDADIIEAMEILGFWRKEDRINSHHGKIQLSLNVDWSVVDAHLSKMTRAFRIKLDLKSLRIRKINAENEMYREAIKSPQQKSDKENIFYEKYESKKRKRFSNLSNLTDGKFNATTKLALTENSISRAFKRTRKDELAQLVTNK